MAEHPTRSQDSTGRNDAQPCSGESERRRITGRAGIVGAGTLLSRLFGLLRDLVLAAVFSRAATDAFFVAFTIPNVLRQLLAEGAVQNAVLPVLSETREREGDARARELFRALRGVSWLLLTVVTALGMLAAPWLVELFAGGYKAHTGQFERTVTLTRWLFPYIFFMGTAAMGVAALNVHRRFVVTSFAPALLNVSFVIFALTLPAWLVARGSDRAYALVVGALVGGLLQVVAQWPSLKAIACTAWPKLNLRHPGVREVLRRMTPVLAGVGVYYVDVMLARRFLSELPVGSQSYFTWAMRLCDFPQGIFVMALQTATLPSLAMLAARGDRVELARTVAFGLRLALFVGLAASALFVGLAEPLVIMLFQRGSFDATSAQQTAQALVAQGLGIWMVAVVRQLVAAYYALGDTKTPVLVAAVDLGVFVTAALLLRGSLGHVGVSLAVTLASSAQMLLLWYNLARKLPELRLADVFPSALRTLLAAVVAAGVAALCSAGVAGHLGGDGLSRLLPGAAGFASFGLVFLALARLLRSQELQTIVEAVRRRF